MGVGVLLQNDVLFEQNCVYVRQASATPKKGGPGVHPHGTPHPGIIWRNLVANSSSVEEVVQSRCKLLLQLISTAGAVHLHGIGP